MKTKTLSLIVAMAMPIAVSADVMMWQVPSSVTADKVINSGGDLSSWTYAVLRATTAATSEAAIYQGTGQIKEEIGSALYNHIDSSDNTYNAVGSSVFNTASVFAELPADHKNTAYNYYIELYDSSNTLVGFTSAVSESTLASYIASSVEQATQLGLVNSPWSPNTFTVVPEPTSGVMLLLGAALLGLRRRRIA